MYVLIRIIAGLCVAILLSVLFCIDEQDKKKAQDHTSKSREKQNQTKLKLNQFIELTKCGRRTPQ